MKKTYLAGLAALAFAGNVMADVAIGDDETGVINFMGTVVAGACNVTVVADSDTVIDGSNLVTLPVVSTTNFSGIDSTTGDQDFSIDFSDCDVNTTAFELMLTGAFTGSSGVVNAEYDADPEDATLGFQITAKEDDGSKTVVDWATTIHRNERTTEDANTDGDYSFPLNVAYYQKTTATPTGGIARATVNYLVSYQ